MLFFTGTLIGGWNILATIRRAPAGYAVEPEVVVPPLVKDLAAPGAVTPANTYDHVFFRLQHSVRHGIHRMLEGVPVPFTVLVVLALAVGSLVEAIPMFFDKENVKEIASVTPYTPLEVVGRDIYVREGCYNCHSQQVRPFRFETERYGEYSKAGEYIYDRPFQWGSKRTGPDLHRVGGKYPSLWHVRHMREPDSTTPGSVMPRYPHLLTSAYDRASSRSCACCGRSARRTRTARSKRPWRRWPPRRRRIQRSTSKAQKVPIEPGNKEIAALTAYLQRLGTDIKWRLTGRAAAFAPVSGTSLTPAGAPAGPAPAPQAPVVK